MRSQKYVHKFETSEPEKISRSIYQRMALHPNGNIIAKGHPTQPFIRLWDVRMIKKEYDTSRQLKTESVHKKIILDVKFYTTRTKTQLLSIGEDNAFYSIESDFF